MSHVKVAAAAALLAAAAATPAWGADAEGKWISGAVNIEVQYDRVFDATDDSEGGDLFTTTEPEVLIHFTPELYLRAGAVLEPVLDRDEDNRYFEDHGLYLETLVLAYETESVGAYGGKFTPIFGLHDFAPGIYGDTFMADYELTERLGFGGKLAGTAEGVGTATLQASVFTLDDSVLSDSAFTRRGRTERSNGGVGNTEGLKNYAIAADLVPAAAENLNIRLAYVHQAEGQGDPEAQDAFEVGLVYEHEISEELKIVPMIDWVRADGASFDQGISDPEMTQDIITTGFALEYGQWFGTLTGGLRFTDQTGGGDPDDKFIQGSVGYLFDIGVAVEAGLIGASVDDTDTVGGGLLVSYGLEF